MTTDHEQLRAFQEAYLDYLEGDRDAPPTVDTLAGEKRRAAEAFIETIKAARGIDPYASRPPLEELLESGSEVAAASKNLGSELQHHLRKSLDPEARVTVDAVSGATGLDLELGDPCTGHQDAGRGGRVGECGRCACWQGGRHRESLQYVSRLPSGALHDQPAGSSWRRTGPG